MDIIVYRGFVGSFLVDGEGGTGCRSYTHDCQIWQHTRHQVSNTNLESIAQTFYLLWRPSKDFTMQDMRENRMSFAFDDEVDLENVLPNKPLTLDKSLVVFLRVIEDVPIEKMVLWLINTTHDMIGSWDHWYYTRFPGAGNRGRGW